MPQIPVVLLKAEELQGGIRTTSRDRNGRETGQILEIEGARFRLEGEAYGELVRIAQGVQNAPDYKEAVSLELLKSLVFDWLVGTHQAQITKPLRDFLEEKCEPLIQEGEVWIPVAGTFVEEEFSLGHVTLKTITPAMIDEWEAELLRLHPEASEDSDEFFHQRRRDLQGLAAATLRVRAEPQHAYDLGQREAEIATAFLRCLSIANNSARLVCPSAPLGEAEAKRFQQLLVREGKVSFFHHGFESFPGDQWAIDAYTLQCLRKCGLDRVDAFLKVNPKSAFQKQVLSAMLLYSRSSLSREPADKLTYALIPLQDLLLDGQGSSEELGERMGMLLGEDENRRQVIADVRTVSELRAAFVRGDASEVDVATLERFLRSTWLFFINLMANHDRFSTRQDFISNLEKMRLSRGLPAPAQPTAL